MAVGAHNANIAGLNSVGFVKLYGRNGTDWIFFQQINGPAGEYGYFGKTVDLSYNGSTMAVAAFAGAVYMYTFSNITSNYNLFHTTPDVDAHIVCISGDGSTFGVTPTSNIGARIFVRNDNGFQQRGNTFTDFGGQYSGVALNYNGTIAAIADVYWSNSRGRVSLFQWTDNNNDGSMEWIQMGSDITGDVTNDWLGYVGCVSITYDGFTVAVGAPYYDKDELESRGLVRVYNYDSTIDMWNQSGSDLLGDGSGDYFSKTAFSSDGTHLAVGAWGFHGNYVKILKKIGSNYEMIGDKMTSGSGVHERFGFTVDMTTDGAAVAIGAPYFSNNKGRAYSLVRNESIHTINPSAVPSTPPSIFPTAAVSKTDFALKFLSNDSTFDFAGTSTEKEIIIKSLISNKALRDSFEQTILVGIDCKSKLVDEYPEDPTLVTISNNSTLDVIVGKNMQVTSEIDIDTSSIVSKGKHANSTKSIYSEYEDNGVEKAKVEFCIRTDYGKVNITTSEGAIESSINFYKVKIVINFVLEFGFTSSNVTIKEEEAGEAQQTAVITSNLEACDCPANADSSTDCYETDTSNAKTYNQNDILSVCVYDPNRNTIITSFKDVELGNGQISTQVIDPDGRPTALASVGKLNEEMAMVNTRIVSAFFDTSDGTPPALVTVSGTAVIGFKTTGARKLASVGMKGARGMRKLQDEDAVGEGTFDVEVILSDDEQVDESPGFDVLEYGITSLVMAATIPMILL